MPASERLWRIGGVIVGIALAVVTGIWEAVLTPMFVVSGGHVIRLPVAPLVAIIANIAIVWFTLSVTRHIVLSLIPALAWVIVMFAAGAQTSDGDLIVEGTWVGLTTILLGAVSWAAGAYIWTSHRGRRTWAPPAPAAAPADPTTSRPGSSPASNGARRPGPARTRPKKSRSR